MTNSHEIGTQEKLKPIVLADFNNEQFPVRDNVQANSESEAQAESFVNALLAIEPRNESEKRQAIQGIETLGASVQKKLARHNSKMLKAPAHLISEAEDGGMVARNILDLQAQIAKVNPNQFDFSPGGFRKLLDMLPFVGTPLARWYAKYQTVEQVLQDITKNMEAGRKELENDNITLLNDQEVMRSLTFTLDDYIQVGILVQQKLRNGIGAMPDDEPRKVFLQEKILFPLNQRIMDLQQQLAVNQQGYLSVEVIVENNKQLIRGVDRALTVTMTALGVAATLAIALKRQKKVLDATDALNKTTGDMLVQTSEQLKTQGVEIQKQASQANLDTEKVRLAFGNVLSAIEDLAQFRVQALEPMQASIENLSTLTEEMEKAISKVEQGHDVESQFLITLEATN